jgi:large subunit ribosomal protein L25
MKEVSLQAQNREVTSKSDRKTLRGSGMIPAVFYGHNEKPHVLTVNAKEFDKLIHTEAGSNVLVNLQLADGTKTAIVKEIQRDIITQYPIHIDFQAISLKEQIEVNVPLHIAGTAPGVKLSGGVLEHILREVRVRCLPGDIPQFVNVDVSSLQINNSLAVKDLPQLPGVEILTDPGMIIINIVAPTVLEEAPAATAEAATAAGTAAEPEVISKGKKEKEGEEGAAAPAPEKGKEK